MQPIQSIIEKTRTLIWTEFQSDASGHDYWHTERVWKMARLIGQEEGGDASIVELAALLHDIADWKFHGGDTTAGPSRARQWLAANQVTDEIIDPVCEIVAKISFKGAEVAEPTLTLEGKIVQDADRLEAIGAIGVARAFAYGGAKGSPLYDPRVPPKLHASSAEYFASRTHTINHFYEKLLLLKDRLHTAAARRIAQERHQFLEQFLERFLNEWNLQNLL